MSTPTSDVRLRSLAPTFVGADPRVRLGWLDAGQRQVAFGGGDAACVAIALTLAGYAGVQALVVTVTWLVALAAIGVYHPERLWSRWQVGYEATKALVFWGLVVGVASGLWPHWGSLYELAPAAGLAWVASVGWRQLGFRRFAAVPARWVVIVGADAAGAAIADAMRARPTLGYAPVGFVDDDPTRQNRRFAGLPVLGPPNRLPGLAQALAIDAVVVRSIGLSCQGALVDCVERGTGVLTMAALHERLWDRVPVTLIDGGWFLSELGAGQRRLYASSRRLLDVGVAIAGLVATALLLPFIALAMRVAGGSGPLIYAQRRVGLYGAEFTIYKFRTMRVDAEATGAAWARQNDDRVTPVGRVLRRTRLDELPQFWNVLKGEMSVVGPRPERPEFTRVIAEKVPFYNRRHMVPPGLTGWAQVRFPYGASIEDALEKLQYDLYYIKHRSFYLDLKIMAKTFGVMVKKIGSR